MTSGASTSSMPRSPSPRQPQRRNLVQPLGLAHKYDTNAKVTSRGERSIDLNVWRVVASHCVENDFARERDFTRRPISHNMY